MKIIAPLPRFWMIVLLCAVGCAAQPPALHTPPPAETSLHILPPTAAVPAAAATVVLPSPTPRPSATPVPTEAPLPTAAPSPTLPAAQLAALSTQLIAAAERGDSPALLQLLARGAPLNARDARGRTPLMAATHANRPAAVQTLLQAGADVNLADKDGVTPLAHARRRGFSQIASLLQTAGGR